MKKIYNLRKGIFLLLSLMAFSYSAHTANITWSGAGTTTNWSDGNNWVGGAIPGANDLAIFNNAATVTFTAVTTTVKLMNINANVTLDIGIGQTLNVAANSNPVKIDASTLLIASGTFNVTAVNDAVQFRGAGGKFDVAAGATVNISGNKGFVSKADAISGEINNAGVINLMVVTDDGITLNNSDPLTLVNDVCAVINLGASRIKTSLTATSTITNNGLITFNPNVGVNSGGILLRVGSTAINNGFYDYSNSANFATGNAGTGTLVDNGIELNPVVLINAATNCVLDLTSATAGMAAYDWAFGGTNFATNSGDGLLDITAAGFPNETGPHTITVDCFQGTSISIEVENVCEASVVEIELPVSSCDVVRLRNVETGEFLTTAGGSAQPVTMSDLGEPQNLDCMPNSEASQNTHWSLVESGDFINIDSRSETGGTGILRAPGAGGPGGAYVVVSTTRTSPANDNDKIWTILYDQTTDTYRFGSTTTGRFLYHNPDGTVTHSVAPATDNRSVWEAIPLDACISIIDDPCACSDEMNLLMNGEYFYHEVVEITSTTCNQWDMVSVTSGQAYDAIGNILPLPLMGTETPVGSGIFLFEFWHIAGDGFSADFTEGTTSEMLSIGNVCDAPTLDVVCPATNDLGTFNCNTLGNIPACPTDEVSAEAAPYGLTITNMSCGDIVVLCADNGMIDNCAVGTQTITRTITVLNDLNGNSTVDAGELSVDCEFTITMEPDMIDPMIDTEAMDMTVECDGAGNTDALNAWLASNGGAAASDACGGVIFTNDFTALSGGCGATGSAMVTFTATDDCGNTAATTASFIIEDTTDPIIDTEAMDMTVECDGAGNTDALNVWLANIGGGAASDACGGVILTNDFTALSDDCGATGSAMVTFTATDDCGNTNATTASFTIEDTTDPMIDTEAMDMTVECDGAGNTDALNAWLANNGEAAASDACGGVIFTNDFTALSDDCGATGSAMVTFTATDDCGNTAATTANFIIEDTTDPMIDTEAMDMTVECDGAGNTDALNAWLANNGAAIVTDVCGGVIFTNDFTALSDDCGATGSAMVTFTATDDCGNTTATTASFTIEDTTDPVITCPLDQILVCNTDPLPSASTIVDFTTIGGTISEDCSQLSELTISFVDSPINQSMLNFCADDPVDRTLTRTYTITDACGNASTCAQNFIYDQITTGPVITSVPPDQTIDCAVNAIPQPHLVDYSTECAVEATITVSESSNGTAGCNGSTIAYTYTLTDACGRSVEAVQTYTLANDGPEFVCPVDICVIECPADTDMIQAQFDGYANLATVISSCGENGITVSNNFNPNGFIPQNCMNPTIAVDGAVAYQIVRFTASDDCGRNATCTALVVIKDNDGPEMDGNISFGLADCNDADLQQGYTDWATAQLNNLSATDGCSNGEVTFSYSPLSPNVDCNSGLASTEVSFIAMDACGNTTIQTASYRIIDNGTSEPSTATVSGNLYTEDNEMIALANVEVEGFMNNQMTTNDDGYYHFDLAMAHNYSIEPTRNDDPLNGITTYDLVLLGQHLLQLNLLDSPYKLIAADVNESGSITASDMIQLRRLILNIDDEFSAGRSWTFIDAAYVFPNPQNPFATTYPTAYSVNNLTNSEITNFIGVKLGDLNASANTTLLQTGDTRSADGELKFKLKDQILKADQRFELAFKANDFKDVSGFQFTLDFDADLLELIDYQRSDLDNMTTNNFGFTKSDEGKVTVSWNETQAISMVDDATLFSLKFTALEEVKLSEVLRINSSVTSNEVYQADLRKEIVLDFGRTNAGEKEFVLLQNQPNPFSQQTMIGFQLTEATEATLTIFDVAGRTVWSQTKSYETGMHQVMMDKSDLGATGVFYYQLSTGKHMAGKKMILLR